MKAQEQTNALLALLVNRRRSKGYQKFFEERKGVLNESVNAEREAKKIPHTKHAGMLQDRVSQEWQVLSKGEKEEWNEKAKNCDMNVVFS